MAIRIILPWRMPGPSPESCDPNFEFHLTLRTIRVISWGLNLPSSDSFMKNSRKKRPFVLPRIATTVLLVVGSLQMVLLSREMATEPGGNSPAGMPQSSGEVFYVSLQGNDAWSGRLPEPNAARTDGPLATLARARDAIRSMRAEETLRRPVIVYMRGGVYTLGAPLVFLTDDSGTPEAPITYTSYPGEEVVLSGGRTITGWKKSHLASDGGQSGEGGNVAGAIQKSRPELWTVEVSGVKEGEWHFRQLFVNGERRQRARAPNTGFYRADGEFLPGNPTRFKFHPGDIHAAWADQGDVEVVGLEKWAEFRMPLKAVDTGTNTATLSAERQPFGDDQNARYWVENAADALDAPGEWYLDRRTGMLSYFAKPGEDMSGAQSVASLSPAIGPP